MRMARSFLTVFLVVLFGCGDDDGSGGSGGAGGGGSTTTVGGETGGGGGTGGNECDRSGKPEMTGPIQGLQPSYLAGDPIDIAVPVDEDTARVIVGVYEVGSELYLGGTAEDTTGSTAQALSLFAGVVGGETGTFYIAVELCSTSVCTPPFIRNTYQRVDRTLPMLEAGETYEQTWEDVGGGPAIPHGCPSPIPIQSFQID